MSWASPCSSSMWQTGFVRAPFWLWFRVFHCRTHRVPIHNSLHNGYLLRGQDKYTIVSWYCFTICFNLAIPHATLNCNWRQQSFLNVTSIGMYLWDCRNLLKEHCQSNLWCQCKQNQNQHYKNEWVHKVTSVTHEVPETMTFTMHSRD